MSDPFTNLLGNTALYHAVGSGYDKYVDVLLAAGADLEVGAGGIPDVYHGTCCC